MQLALNLTAIQYAMKKLDQIIKKLRLQSRSDFTKIPDNKDKTFKRSRSA